MTEAQTGLRKALVRGGGSVTTIAEMQTKTLLAELTDEQRAELAAELAPESSADAQPPADTADEPAANEPDGDEGDEQPEAAHAADPRVKAVAAAVANDDACKGKADLALQMLADDDYAQLSASGVIKLLGKQPAAASAGDPDAAARAEMKAALAASTNSDAAPDGGKKPAKGAEASAAWGRVIADMNPNKAG